MQGFGKLALPQLGGTIAADGLSQFLAALKQCSKTRDLEGGKRIHQDAVAAGLHLNRFVAAALITMYSKCRNMALAQQVFDNTALKDVVVWNSIILGYAENNDNSVAIDLYARMDCPPVSATYLAVLKACAGLAKEADDSERQSCLNLGIYIHNQARARGFASNMFVGNSLVRLYSKCKSMEFAREVFDSLVCKNVVNWNALILGYAENGESAVALDLFSIMDCEPVPSTYIAALKACGALASENESEKEFCLSKGVSMHERIKLRGYDADRFVATSLVGMYGKCGSMENAREVFEGMLLKDVVTWNSLILGYAENGQSSVALDLFSEMDCEPNSATYVAALKACGNLANKEESEKQSCLNKGIAIHKQLKEQEGESNIVLGTSLVEMYRKCGSVEQAREIFDKMASKNVTTWNSLIMGYVENGENTAALDLFSDMDCHPNPFTYAAAVKACVNLRARGAGQQIHDSICKLGLEQNSTITTTLIDFYGKCGSVTIAEELFNNIHSPDLRAWNVLLAGYSALGEPYPVLSLANKLQEAGVSMNGTTLSCIFSACSRAGLVEKGKSYFGSISRFGIRVEIEHYNCIVDMLGRANRLSEALDLTDSMPVQADTIMWMTLLEVCKKWKNLDVGKVAFNAIVASGTQEEAAAAYALLSDIYRSLGMVNDLQRIETENGLEKEMDEPYQIDEVTGM